MSTRTTFCVCELAVLPLFVVVLRHVPPSVCGDRRSSCMDTVVQDALITMMTHPVDILWVIDGQVGVTLLVQLDTMGVDSHGVFRLVHVVNRAMVARKIGFVERFV